MSIALWVKVEALEKLTAEQQLRIAALERTRIASRKPLADRAAANRAAGEALCSEVRMIFEQHAGSGRLTAKRVLSKLTRDPKPSERRVQEILRRLCAESAMSRT